MITVHIDARLWIFLRTVQDVFATAASDTLQAPPSAIRMRVPSLLSLATTVTTNRHSCVDRKCQFQICVDQVSLPYT